jgi:hypothetical protein
VERRWHWKVASQAGSDTGTGSGALSPTAFGPAVVYFDRTAGNQDPYVWNEAFLHSYCHITQFHAEAGDINLWVSGDRFPRFSHLYCDLLFVVASKCPWENANDLRRDDPIVDSEEAWDDHYRWYPQHPPSGLWWLSHAPGTRSCPRVSRTGSGSRNRACRWWSSTGPPHLTSLLLHTPTIAHRTGRAALICRGARQEATRLRR